MIIFVVIFFLLLLVGWSLSSLAGIVLSMVVYTVIFFALTQFFKLLDVDPTESFIDGIRSYVGLIFASILFFTTPIWDSDGYCEHQKDTFEVNDRRTMEDVFKGRQPTTTYVKDISEECKAQGGWEFIGGWDSDNNWRVDVLYILGFFACLVGLVVIGFVAMALFVVAGAGVSTFNESSKRKEKKTVPEAIKDMQEYLDVLIKYNQRSYTAEINGAAPPLKECELEQLNEIKSIYVNVLELLPSLYKPKEVEKGMYERKKISLEKKLALIEKHIDRLG